MLIIISIDIYTRTSLIPLTVDPYLSPPAAHPSPVARLALILIQSANRPTN